MAEDRLQELKRRHGPHVKIEEWAHPSPDDVFWLIAELEAARVELELLRPIRTCARRVVDDVTANGMYSSMLPAELASLSTFVNLALDAMPEETDG